MEIEEPVELKNSKEFADKELNSLIFQNLRDLNKSINEISVVQERHSVTLENQNTVLQEIKDDLIPLKFHLNLVCAGVRLGGMLAGFIGCIWAFVEIISVVKGWF